MPPGFYELIVTETATGNNIKSAFSLEYVLFVASFTPHIGSIRGGTLLHIFGDGFNADQCDRNQVRT